MTWILHSFAEDHARHIKWFSGVHYYILDGQKFINIELMPDRQIAEELIYKATRSRPHLPGSLV